MQSKLRGLFAFRLSRKAHGVRTAHPNPNLASPWVEKLVPPTVSAPLPAACRVHWRAAGDVSPPPAGAEIVVEDFLDGEEASFFALVDGETCVALASAQDHKAVGEGDVGDPTPPPPRPAPVRTHTHKHTHAPCSGHISASPAPWR